MPITDNTGLDENITSFLFLLQSQGLVPSGVLSYCSVVPLDDGPLAQLIWSLSSVVSLLRECHLSKCHTRLCTMAWGQAGHDGSATWDSKQMIEDCFSGLDSSQDVQGSNWGPDCIFRWTSCSPQRALNCGSGTGQSNHEEEKVQGWDLALWEGGVTSAERRNAPRSDRFPLHLIA